MTKAAPMLAYFLQMVMAVWAQDTRSPTTT